MFWAFALPSSSAICAASVSYTHLDVYKRQPVFNGLTDADHPTQILADMMTIEEHISKPLSKVKVVFAGDIRNNMSYAWMYGCAKRCV